MAIIGTPTSGNDTITGDGANNLLDALTGGDTVNGAAGNDTLTGNFGNDTLIGGLGDDILKAGAGIDRLVESGDANFTLTNSRLTGTNGFGNDTLSDFESAALTGGASGNLINAAEFSKGPVTINGQAGDDSLRGGGRNDLIVGGVGNDSLSGNSGDDQLNGGDGNDLLDSGIGEDTLIGGNGIDELLISNSEGSAKTFILTNTSLLISGSVGSVAETDKLSSIEKVRFSARSDGSNNIVDGDFFSAASFTLGPVSLFGSFERDTLIGGAGSDLITGNIGSDFLSGQGGNDTISAGSNDDTVQGGDGNDTLTADGGFDRLFGGNGDDTLLSGIATPEDGDEFNGGGGNDTLIGSAGFFEIFNGGAGNDVLTGGGRKNNFFDFDSGRAFATADLGIDTITDFAPNGDDDVIRLSARTFTAISGSSGFNGGGVLDSSLFAVVTNDAVAETSSAVIVYNSVNGKLFYNQNTTVAGFGSGGQFVVLTGSPDNLSAADFSVINS